ncbi:MAG: hypothetical protein NTV97_33955 [Alphaproteobacteria bacterium]|nr:hypothetical protein [Alphaproteobacteria bacterium]
MIVRLLCWLARRLDRRPSPVGLLKRPHLLGLHMNEATSRAIVATPFPFVR